MLQANAVPLNYPSAPFTKDFILLSFLTIYEKKIILNQREREGERERGFCVFQPLMSCVYRIV